MLEKGFIKEVENLINKYNISVNSESMKCIGYRQIYSYIKEKKNKE